MLPSSASRDSAAGRFTGRWASRPIVVAFEDTAPRRPEEAVLPRPRLAFGALQRTRGSETAAISTGRRRATSWHSPAMSPSHGSDPRHSIVFAVARKGCQVLRLMRRQSLPPATRIRARPPMRYNFPGSGPVWACGRPRLGAFAGPQTPRRPSTIRPSPPGHEGRYVGPRGDHPGWRRWRGLDQDGHTF